MTTDLVKPHHPEDDKCLHCGAELDSTRFRHFCNRSCFETYLDLLYKSKSS